MAETESGRKQFGALVRRLRKRVPLTQAELAERAGLSPQTIGAYETGLRLPEPESVRRLADALELEGDDRGRFLAAWRLEEGEATPLRSGATVGDDEGAAPTHPPTDALDVVRGHGAAGDGALATDYPFFVPNNLPPHYIERTEALEQVRAALLDQKRDSIAIGIVAAAAVHGQGGIGKTVLARAICDDPAVRAAFPDGVLWATLGQQADPLRHQRNWIRELDGDPASAANLESGTVRLRDLLADKACLLVIDDIWV